MKAEERPIQSSSEFAEFHGRIPTPARSHRGEARPGCEVGIQVSRHSIDGHATAAAAEERSAQARGVDAAVEANVCNAEEERNRLCDINFPEVSISPKDDSYVGQHRGKAALAQVLTSVLADVFESMSRAWRLGSPGGESRVEEAVATWLRMIARKAERACVVRALRPTASTASESASTSELEARCAKLEAELMEVDARIESLDDAESDFVRLAGLGESDTSSSKALKDFLDSLAFQSPAVGGNTAVSIDVLSEKNLEQFLQRLAVLDLWFHRTFVQLEETQEALEEREHIVAAQGFAHLNPTEAPNARKALACLR